MPPRVYIPVTVHDAPAEAPRSPRGLGAIVRAGLISEDDGPPEWREHMRWWYRWSSFAYCIAGGLLFVRSEPMYRHAQPCCFLFPFRSMGALIFLNGLLSYMADTHTFGYPSAWRTADSYVATFNTLLQFILIILQVIGPMSFPRDMVTVFTASLLIAIGCKRRAVAAFKSRDRDAYLVWHALWHVVLPAGAVAGQLLLEP